MAEKPSIRKQPNGLWRLTYRQRLKPGSSWADPATFEATNRELLFLTLKEAYAHDLVVLKPTPIAPYENLTLLEFLAHMMKRGYYCA